MEVTIDISAFFVYRIQEKKNSCKKKKFFFFWLNGFSGMCLKLFYGSNDDIEADDEFNNHKKNAHSNVGISKGKFMNQDVSMEMR